MVYGIDGAQSGQVMFGYKAPRPSPMHRAIVRDLCILGLRGHARCASLRLMAAPKVYRWSTVPSLKDRDGEHPLHEIVASVIRGQEIELRCGTVAPGSARFLDPDHFVVEAPIPPNTHVFVVEDTWASGNHAQSAAVALHRAGARWVSVLAIARWLNMSDWRHVNEPFIKEQLTHDFDVDVCPWTGSSCPS